MKGESWATEKAPTHSQTQFSLFYKRRNGVRTPLIMYLCNVEHKLNIM